MALGKMTKSENCFQILEVSLSIPLNKDDHDPLQEMYITHENLTFIGVFPTVNL